MKLLKKSHLSDSEYSHLKLELDPYFAGQMHQRHLGWGDEGQSIYIYETAPDNVDHNTLSRYPVNWSALSQEESESTEDMDALEFFGKFTQAIGDPVEVWSSRIPLTIINNIDKLQDPAPLHRQYSGQSEPQDAYLEIHGDQVFLEYNPEIGNAVPMGVYHGSILRIPVPSDLTVEGCRKMFEEHADTIATIQEGMDTRWDGNNNIGTLTEEAAVALEELTAALEDTQGYPRCLIVTAEDWLHHDTIKPGTSAEEIIANSKANLDADFTDILIEGLDDYLEALASPTDH